MTLVREHRAHPCSLCRCALVWPAVSAPQFNWHYRVCRLVADVTCASAPEAALTFGPGDWGSWPAGCAGKTYRQLCVASCNYGGHATVNCMADAQWNTTAAGGCGECECTGAGTGAVLLLLHGV